MNYQSLGEREHNKSTYKGNAYAVVLTDGDFIVSDVIDPLPSPSIPGVALYVGTDGNITVKMEDSGDNITFANVPSGTILYIRVAIIYKIGTTASNIVALF